MTANRLTGLSAILFGILFIVSLFLLSSIPVGGGASTDQEIRDFYGDSGDRVQVVIGLYLAVLSAVLFLVFVGGLYRGWPAMDTEPRRTLLLSGALVGAAFAVAYTVGAALLAAVAGGIELGSEPDDLPDTGVVRFLGQAGYGVSLVAGGILAGAFALLVSGAALGSARFPRWAAWLGIAVGIIVAAISVAFIPMVLFPLWVILIGVLVMRPGR